LNNNVQVKRSLKLYITCKLSNHLKKTQKIKKNHKHPTRKKRVNIKKQDHLTEKTKEDKIKMSKKKQKK